jgi:hypothetical protein
LVAVVVAVPLIHLLQAETLVVAEMDIQQVAVEQVLLVTADLLLWVEIPLGLQVVLQQAQTTTVAVVEVAVDLLVLVIVVLLTVLQVTAVQVAAAAEVAVAQVILVAMAALVYSTSITKEETNA